jgi:hypothetical protein
MDSVPTEYLYADQHRLDAYVAEIRGGLATYDKVPSYSVEVGLLGPKIAAEQSTQLRELTTAEKLTVLRNHLVRVDSDSVFQERPLLATKVILPRSIYRYPPELPDIVFWVAFDGSDGAPTTYLIEGEAGEDCPPARCSGYSGLLWVLDHVYTGVELGDGGVVEGIIRPQLESPVEILNMFSADVRDLKPATLELLSRTGAVISGERPIRSLYRVRVRGMGDYTVGYPIYIAEDVA